jgi:hypothetical protein
METKNLHTGGLAHDCIPATQEAEVGGNKFKACLG